MFLIYWIRIVHEVFDLGQNWFLLLCQRPATFKLLIDSIELFLLLWFQFIEAWMRIVIRHIRSQFIFQILEILVFFSRQWNILLLFIEDILEFILFLRSQIGDVSVAKRHWTLVKLNCCSQFIQLFFILWWKSTSVLLFLVIELVKLILILSWQFFVTRMFVI